jgi:hypothetical protein
MLYSRKAVLGSNPSLSAIAFKRAGRLRAELQADDFHGSEVGEVAVLGPDLAAMRQGRRGDPRVVDTRFTSRLQLGCSQACVGRGDAFVRGQAGRLFPDPRERCQARALTFLRPFAGVPRRGPAGGRRPRRPRVRHAPWQVRCSRSGVRAAPAPRPVAGSH